MTSKSNKGITLRIDYPEGRSRVNVSLDGTVKDLRDEVGKAVRFRRRFFYIVEKLKIHTDQSKRTICDTLVEERGMR